MKMRLVGVKTGIAAWLALAAGCAEGHGGPNQVDGDHLVITDAEDLRTSESGTSATFSIALGFAPNAVVSVPISSSDASEGTVAPSVLTFTKDNWNAPQSVVVTGVNDDLADHAVKYAVVLGGLESDDERFRGFDPDDISVTNTDDDTAGVTVDPRSDLSTTESGGTAEFTVVLNAQPAANVTIAIASDNALEGTAAPSSLTFTPSDWNSPQTVIVSGVDDGVADGAKEYQVLVGPITSDDEQYAAIDPDDVTLTNVDDDSPGVQVKVVDATSGENGSTGSVSVVLNSEPTADVVISVASSDASEATAAPATLTFTSSNWKAPQTVTLTGKDDSVADGDQPYTLSFSISSSDSGYAALKLSDVTLTNVDNDSAGVTVSVTDDSSTEGGATAAVSYVLKSQPTANVVLTIAVSDASEASAAPATLTFTSANWNAPQTVLVAGVNDDEVDGDQSYELRVTNITSSDERYDAVVAAAAALTNVDDDTAGISVSVLDASSAEDGSSADVTYVLNSQPTADVVITVASSDASEGVASPTTLTFTTANWAAPQHVLVSGQLDHIADGDQAYQLTVTSVASSDARYDAMIVGAAQLTNVDLDSPGVLVTVVDASTDEGGAQAHVTYALRSQPSADVVITLESSDASEGVASPTTLTFTSVNWAAPQDVYVAGQQDDVADGDQPYQLQVTNVASSDSGYDGLIAAAADLTNVDNDSAGITVTVVDATSDEGGAQAHVTYVLNSEPTADVQITLGSSDATEGVASPTTLTFTALNWAAPQHVYVAGQNDDIADGNVPYELRVTAVTSADDNYDERVVAAAALSNMDDDSAGITVTVVDDESSECCGQAFVKIALNSEPTADVVITVASSDLTEGTVSPTTLTFTAMNWAAQQVVTISGQDDNVADGDQPYKLVVVSVDSDDQSYDGYVVPAVSLVNMDNDSAGITSAVIDGSSSEAGEQAHVTYVLNSEPTADVAITVESSDLTEGVSMSTTLVFTPANWNAPQSVYVTGQNDAVADGDQPYELRVTQVSSSDANYSGRPVAAVALTNVDNDVAGITVVALDATTGEDASSADVTYVLNSQPTADVVLTIASSDVSEGTAMVTLTFTPMNWAAPQHVIITGQNDAVADGPQSYELRVLSVASTDGNYNGRAVGAVALTNVDDDAAGITVAVVDSTTGEDAATADVTYVLNSEPTANVVITVASSDATEGTASPTTLTFTAANWSTPKHVIVTGVNDDLADGNQMFQLTVTSVASTDAGYSGYTVNPVTLTNVDNDTAGITVSAISGHTTEAGGTATFTVRLNSQPFSGVTVHFASNKPAEGTTAVTSLTFTSANWNTNQTVTVTGVHDAIADGNQTYAIVFSATTSGDSTYAAITPPNVAVINDDDDVAGITVSAISGATSESGGTATFTIVLQSQPIADVTVHFASNDATEGTTDGASRTFTAANWNTPQTVTVTGVDDALPDGDVAYSIAFAATTSSDPAYSGLTPASIAVTNLENDYQQFAFVDTAGDDVATTALYNWFNGLTLATTDFIYIELASTGLAGGGRAWCAARADWYRSTYLSQVSSAGTLTQSSGPWSKWARPQLSSAWSGETTASYTNYFGYGEYRWYPDWEISNIGLLIGRSDNNEAYAGVTSTANTNTKVRTAASRFAACGF